jgi:hypothetical protein
LPRVLRRFCLRRSGSFDCPPPHIRLLSRIFKFNRRRK